MNNAQRKTALIAIGGNSLIRSGEQGTIEQQRANAQRTAESIVKIIKEGYAVVLTHGNGPQVGSALIRSERASDQVYEHPLDVCVATTQGEIGYLLLQSLELESARAGISIPVVTILTQVLVDENDPAYNHPTKPIGPFYSKEDALKKKQQYGWDIVEDAARGYRRVVPSPEPKAILEKDIIRKCLEMNMIVIALGGGGIPVVKKNHTLIGSEAVIDKDRASSLLASELGVDLFIISTDTPQVYLGFKSATQRGIDIATVDEMQRYYDRGEFPPGSMGPKIESAIRFIGNGGKRVIITSQELLPAAITGKAGTHIIPSDSNAQKNLESAL